MVCGVVRAIAGFAAALRFAGMTIGVGQLQSLIHALTYLDPNNRLDLYYSARAVLLGRHEQQPLFDRVFSEYWGVATEKALSTPGKMPLAPRHNVAPPQQALATLLAQRARPSDPEVDIRDRQQTASSDEVLRRKDFAQMTEAELRALRHLKWLRPFDFASRETLRRIPHRRSGLLDMRRIAAQAARTGGVAWQLPRRVRKNKPRPLVLLVDISGSMELYARVLLQFFHSLGQQLPQVETFVFATRLTRITAHIRLKDVDVALDEVSRSVTDFSSGTRIGESLHHFNNQWGGRTTRRGAVVMIVSDGCDTGSSDTLRRAMQNLKKHCYRLIWLNPRLSQVNFQPKVRGLEAALPLVDDFMTCHNMQSLERLAMHLTQLPRLRGRTPLALSPARFSGSELPCNSPKFGEWL